MTFRGHRAHAKSRGGIVPPLLGAQVLRCGAGRSPWRAFHSSSGAAFEARPPVVGVAAYCKPENKVSLGYVEGLNTKVRVVQRRAFGLGDEDYLRLKILTCTCRHFDAFVRCWPKCFAALAAVKDKPFRWRYAPSLTAAAHGRECTAMWKRMCVPAIAQILGSRPI
jgi:hypothetical protein